MSARSSSSDPTTSCEQYRRRTRRDEFSSTTLAGSSDNRSFLSIADELRVTATTLFQSAHVEKVFMRHTLSAFVQARTAATLSVGLFSEQRHPRRPSFGGPNGSGSPFGPVRV
ncbi:glycerol-3-phosphate acyltransferase 5 [Striga asiatica]|uniref:Glycerol-3-phosphate acyltransferase 5 n=1 Tax=Striga asiatica TaxID=4170 RepID=A0A5A7P801_STRAF|nr:glycerol-3-phosphate acyltransferase 5 [Striga asiatica]